MLAGGAGSRLRPLTDRRAKPALPCAGMYRLIDVALSNVANSGLDEVWVIEQYEPHALNDHLANGRPWDLDRTHGGLRILPPFQGHDDNDGDEALASGNADAILQHIDLLESRGPDVVVTMSADHLYRLDVRDVLDTHWEAAADLTIVTTDMPSDDDPTRYSWVTVAGDGTVRDFAYKPERPTGDRICTEVFAFATPALVETLRALDDGGSAGDYGDRLVPDLVRAGNVVEHRMDGYWRDVGTLGSFHRAHMELLADKPPLRVDDPEWPFLTASVIGGPARLVDGAEVARSLLSPGCRVEGSVSDSVLGRNVVVAAGATVTSSVVLDDAIIGPGTDVRDAIVDIGITLDKDARGVDDDDSGITVYSDSPGDRA